MAAALMLGYGSLALAGPAGGTVVAGQASITGAPGSTVLKQGTKVKSIRLVGDGDHEVDCRMDGGSFMLKACFLKKA